ncbi:MAG: flagellar biosynthetic protein FliR [Lachnospirales bacterium]
MSDQLTFSLLSSYYNFELILIIFARIIGGISLIPIWSSQNAPTQTKIGLAFIISLLIYSTGNVPDIAISSFIEFIFIVIREVITGVIMSFVVYLFFSIFYFVGRLLDFQIGFSMLNVMDPMTNIQVSITGNLLFYVMAVFFVVSEGLNAFIYTLMHSYEVLPISGLKLISNEALTMYFVQIMTDFFVIGMGLSMPLIGTMLVVNVALGLLVKATPQMNVFVIGMPIKLFFGLIILYITAEFYQEVYNEFYYDMMEALQNVIYLMGSD